MHFTVLVIGPNYEEQLQAFHEFECTGFNDKYIQEIDVTSDQIGDYESTTITHVVLENGEKVLESDPRCFRAPTDEELEYIQADDSHPHAKTVERRNLSWVREEDGSIRVRKKLPTVEIPAPELMSFEKYLDEWYCEQPEYGPEDTPDIEGEAKFGYRLREKDGSLKVITRTNPNSKWDGYRVGGRWVGFFPLKEDAISDEDRREIELLKPFLGKEITDPEIVNRIRELVDRLPMPGSPSWMGPEAPSGYVDKCEIKHVDFERAIKEAREKDASDFDAWEALCTKHGWPRPWSEFLKKVDTDPEYEISQARNEYHQQPAIREAFKQSLFWRDPAERFGRDREKYIQSRERQTLIPHAVLREGEWISSDDHDDWQDLVWKLYETLPPETKLTLVDCHV